MNYSEFLEDILDVQDGLMSEEEHASARSAYSAWVKKTPERCAWKAGTKVINDRAVAALFGGKSLTGSTKQKIWGEKIRAEKLNGEKSGALFCDPRDEMTEAQAVLACAPGGLGRSAHFWIQNRNRKPSEIGKFFDTQKSLLRSAMELRDAGKSEDFKAAVAAYNKLTDEWGFTK